MKVRPPSIDPTHPDRQIACQEAIDFAVAELVDKAVVAGWNPDEVFIALATVTAAQRLAYEADPDPADDPL